ncbi:MAG TPA: DUF2254 domain-containing protein [Saprospiraceae bacterium]|nr:DUF2254 domain-containing protein [Saprospiraceae bacterium]
MKKFLFYWEELKSTFWFIPSVLIFFSIILAFAFLFLDSRYQIAPSGLLPYVFGTDVNSTRSVLSTISGAMISVAGTTFSITLVALTLTSSQFGSRLIKNFMYVRLNQVVLGAYVATYLYCLLVINAIKDANGNAFIPTISILFALILAIVNILLLIVFIHHIATSIQANKVILDVTEALTKNTKSLFPEKIGERVGQKKDRSYDPVQEKSTYSFEYDLFSTEMGYLQYLDSDALLKQIANLGGLVALKIRPGDFVVSGMLIGTLHTKEDIEEGTENQILNHLIFGSTRLHQQDIEFSLNQLVEIAVRALSPGINDPFTANMCIDNLTATVSNLAQVKFPSPYRADEEEQLRLIVPAVNFEGIVEVAFSSIRQYAGGNTPVIYRLMKAFTTIDQFVLLDAHRHVLQRHAQMVWQVGEQHIDQENDLQILKKIAKPLIGDG